MENYKQKPNSAITCHCQCEESLLSKPMGAAGKAKTVVCGIQQHKAENRMVGLGNKLVHKGHDVTEPIKTVEIKIVRI